MYRCVNLKFLYLRLFESNRVRRIKFLPNDSYNTQEGRGFFMFFFLDPPKTILQTVCGTSVYQILYSQSTKLTSLF